MKILTTDTDSRAKRPFAEELREWFTIIADKIYETGMTLSEREIILLEKDAQIYRDLFDSTPGQGLTNNELSDEEKADFIAAVRIVCVLA